MVGNLRSTRPYPATRRTAARFTGDIENRGFGRTIALEIPGGGQMLLYQPRHPTALDL
jgi:hypothetical protein